MTYLCGKKLKISFLTAEEEKVLVQRAQQGDQEAWKQILHAMIPAMRRTARQTAEYYGHPDLVEDCFQEIYLHLLKRCDTFDPAHQVRVLTWAYPHFRAACQRFFRRWESMGASHKKSMKRTCRVFVSSHFYSLADKSFKEPWEDLQESEKRKIIHSILNTIPPKYRDILLMVLQNPCNRYAPSCWPLRLQNRSRERRRQCMEQAKQYFRRACLRHGMTYFESLLSEYIE